jgi:hypothetical protein
LLEIFIAIGLAIMSVAGIFYLFRRQDMYAEKIKKDWDDAGVSA